MIDDDADFEHEIPHNMQMLIDEIGDDVDPHRYAFKNPMSFDALQELMGRAPTREEQLHLLKMQKLLNIGNDDALWYLLIGLRYHLTLYQQIPAEIETKTKQAIFLATQKIREETKKQIQSIADESVQLRCTLTNDIKKSIKSIGSEMNCQIVKIVGQEISRIQHQSQWSYVWFAVASGLLVLLVAILMAAYFRPEIFGG